MNFQTTFQNFSKIDKEIDEKFDGDSIKEGDIEKIKKIFTENLNDSVYLYYYDYYDFVSIFSKNKDGLILYVKFNFSDKMISFKLYNMFNENLKNLKNLEEIYYGSRFAIDYDYSEVITYFPENIKRMHIPRKSIRCGYKEKYEKYPNLEIYIDLLKNDDRFD